MTSTQEASERENESNDNLNLATAISSDGQYIGNLENKTDRDYYSIFMESSGRLSINFDSPIESQTNNYYRIEVLDSLETVVASRDTGSDTSFDVEIPITGTYYLKITDPHYNYIDSDYVISASAVLLDPVPEGAIRGTRGEDEIIGTTNDDIIYGLGGNDEINGLSGADVVAFRTEKANLKVSTIEGISVIRGLFSAGEHAYSTSRVWNVEKIKTRDTEVVLTSVNVDPLFGTTANDFLIGTVEDDLIDGKGGADFIDGKEGSDTLALFGAKSSFVIATVEGITRISSTSNNFEYSNYVIKTINLETLAFNNDENLYLQTNESAKIFGSSANDIIAGSGLDEIFDGQGGIDVIDGKSGFDTLVIFGSIADYLIDFPDENDNKLIISKKYGSSTLDEKITATNIEKISFTDRSVEVKNPPALIITPSTTFISEGGENISISVSLSVRPNSSVRINLAADDQISADKTTLFFDESDWSVPKEITVSAVDDTVFEKSHNGILELLIDAGSDVLYQTIPSSSLNFAVKDNDSKDFGTILGRLWSDRDSDKVLDEGELALAGWTVFIDANSNGILDTGEQQTQSGPSGWYLFEGVVPGTYTIAAETKNGWSPTFPSLQNSEVTLVSDTTTNGIATSGDWGGYSAPLSVFGKSSAETPYVNLGRSTRIQDYLADARFNSQQGEGYAVAVIDTGANLKHPDFTDRIVFQYDFSGSNDGDATDYHGHGTHVAGTIVSDNGNYPGIAPKADLVVLKVFPDSVASASDRDIVEALDWVIRNHEAYNIVAVNMSLGSGEFHNRTQFYGRYSSQLKALANSGVVVVSASGNDYDDNSYKGVSYPSSDAFSLSVGATFAREGPYGGWTEDNQLVILPEIQQGVVDSIAQFSQRGPLSDVFAPGVWINASWLDGGHKPISGTSMASPQVAGMVLLLQELAERALGRRLNFSEVKDLLASTGKTIYDGDDENDSVRNTGEYYEAIDMFSLGEAVLALKPAASHTVSVTAGEISSPKDFGFVANETVKASSSDDFVVGSNFSDVVYGGTGDDRLQGGNGDDTLYGQEGDDYLSGGNGDDVLDGGSGDDTLSGGMGNDTAVFDTKRDDCIITATAGGLMVSSSATGIDTVAGCEFLQFTDQTIVVADLMLPPIDTTKTATYSINSSADSYDEEQSALFSLVTANIAAGTIVAYTLSGISESDLESGSLTGTAIISDSGTTVISISLAADAATEGAETLTITLNEFADKTASVIINDTSKAPPTYLITSGADSYDEGQSALFNLVTTNLVAGTSVAYTISGVSASDLVNNSLTGTATVSATGTTIISLPLAADALTEGTETITITLDDSLDTTASLSVIDTSISSSYKLSAVYDLRDEGSTAYFSLVASGIDAGTVVAYTISGVSASDLVSGSLNETITTAAAGETKLISIPIRKDNLTEGAETLTITLDDSSSTTASLVVNDTSKGATYSITSGSDSYDEGQSALFNLVTTNLVAGTSVAYTISGVSASDLVNNSLTGTATVSATGTTIISLPLAADALTEGTETITITLDDSLDTTASLVVNDTSKAPVVEVTEYRTTILGDKNIVGPEPILIRGLTENITKTNGVITEQFFQYAGARYDYSDIDSVITVITRNGEFTEEFSQEISDYASSLANTTYSDVVKIVGSSSIDAWLITVAGDDGNYIG
ncbi:S8 family serine peptidase [Gammaproteobacteria bacterium]|nr:S8 family serine peptidase [Gammaproteobacteria bacterium]